MTGPPMDISWDDNFGPMMGNYTRPNMVNNIGPLMANLSGQ
jgi:hypothetical protein